MKYNCSHKAIEWRQYFRERKSNKNVLPPTEYCVECIMSFSMKPKAKDLVMYELKRK